MIDTLLASLHSIGFGNFVLNKDSFIRALWNASATVDAGIGVNVEPWPLCFWLAANYTLYRTYIYTGAISQAKTCDNVCHGHSPIVFVD
jgi:hypothetical protein